MMVMGGQWGVKGGPLEVHEGSKGGVQNVFVHITKCICPNWKMHLGFGIAMSIYGTFCVLVYNIAEHICM